MQIVASCVSVTFPKRQNWERGVRDEGWDFRNIPKKALSNFLITHGETEAPSRERTWPRPHTQCVWPDAHSGLRTSS